MSVNLSTESIARASSRRPWITVGIWVVVFILAVFLRASLFEDVITTEFAMTNDPESAVGKDLIEEKLTGPKGTNELVLVQSQELTVDDPEFQQIVNAIHADVAALGPEIIRQETLLNYFQTPAEFLVSQDRHTMIMPFTMAGDIDDAADHIEGVADLVDGYKGNPNFKVLMVGQATVGLDFQEVAQEGLLKGEVFGAPIALVILILVPGALVAAVIPLIMAVVAIVLAMGLASLAGQGFELSFFVENMITMIGLAGGLLIAAVFFFFDIKTGAAGVSSFPDGIESKEGFEILDREFSFGEVTPAEIVIDGDVNSPAVQAAIGRLTTALESDSQFSLPRPLTVSEDGKLGLLAVPVDGDSSTQATIDSIKRLPNEYIPAAFQGVPAEVYVTGETALNIDFFEMAGDVAKLVIPFVLAVSFLLLMIVFRSLVVPIKAIILNLLSVGATYGILVLVFQKGVLADELGFQQAGTIEAWIPIFLFAIIFGLSMDYHVFLLSRVRERFDQTLDNAESVAFGIRSTGRLITGAALIMVAVFLGFAAGDIVPLQQMGFGLGIAILLDATIVRIILVPASMKLLGKWNWYLPKWLEWMPDLRVECGSGVMAPTPADD